MAEEEEAIGGPAEDAELPEPEDLEEDEDPSALQARRALLTGPLAARVLLEAGGDLTTALRRLRGTQHAAAARRGREREEEGGGADDNATMNVGDFDRALPAAHTYLVRFIIHRVPFTNEAAYEKKKICENGTTKRPPPNRTGRRGGRGAARAARAAAHPQRGGRGGQAPPAGPGRRCVISGRHPPADDTPR
jgi:hypothetical protein